MLHENDTAARADRVIAGRYRMRSRIGSGAMGAVWSGTDELLLRPVAIKELRLPSGVPEDEFSEFHERALREARALAVVTHPNVVMLYDVAEDGGVPFVVMELVPAESLGTVLKRGPLDVHQLAVCVDGVAGALQAAHRVGIVHRDVKPGNVLLGRHRQVKLGDFGISRNAAESTLTRTGVVLGTPAFVAPEIVAGESPTPAADLWSLGATLFAAAERRLPYDSDSDPLITLSSILHGRVPEHRQTGPVGEVLSGLMVKDPARRMPLHEVRRRLAELTQHAGETPFEPVLDPHAPAVQTVTASPGPASEATVSQPRLPGSAPQPGTAPAPTTVDRAKPRSRRGVLTIALGGLAAVLVAGGAAAGFFYARSGVTPAGVPQAGRPGTTASDAFSELQAEAFSGQTGGVPVDRTGGFVGPLGNGDTLQYEGVQFGGTPAKQVTAQLASWIDDGVYAKIDVRVDDPASEPIGKIRVTADRSGGEQIWKPVPVDLTRPISGTHTVYLTFVSEEPEDFTNLNWFQFHR
ncbi:protein kinase domain-containing protein [Saccharopolyspora taberi]|uniref:non-specific serine/threonine protein kinase n=1 Tax=Saccharopolyspora taberi TaxID=60895 RepID=A0ABN3VDF5_9PSEU